jgi:hypothetical protein
MFASFGPRFNGADGAKLSQKARLRALKERK